MKRLMQYLVPLFTIAVASHGGSGRLQVAADRSVPPGARGANHIPDVPQDAAEPSAADASRIVLPPDSPQLSLIKTEVVRFAKMPIDEVVAPGRIEFDPNRISRVHLPVAGRINRVLVSLGDAVTAGQALLLVESPEAEGALSEWRQSTANVAQAKAFLIKVSADRDRISDLLAHKAVAQKELLSADLDLAQARTNRDQAEAALEHARRRLEILGLDPAMRNQMVTVRAPISGKVIEIAVANSEFRSDTNLPLLTLADLSQVWVASDVPEKLIRFIEKGEKIEVTLVAYPGELFAARVSRIADTVDPRTRTISVLSVLPNPHGRLRPEMYGTIRHSHGSRTVTTVPAGAITRSGADTLVFVERERGVFTRLKIRTGASLNGTVPVLEGLQPGDRVVTNGAMLLSAIPGR
jgi:cobalt-zinc-cadmium efflux system membrane fusion protein